MEGPKPGAPWEENGMEPFPSSNHYSEQHVTLHLQFISDQMTRGDNYFFMHDTVIVANTVVGSLCLAALLGAATALCWRITHVNWAGKAWWSRQRRVVILLSAQLWLQLVNATFYLAPNAYYLANRSECPYFLLPMNVFGFIRWTCWAALFFLLVVQAHSMLPAHVILTHPLMKPLVWAFVQRWPPPPPSEGLMGYDLPPWVLLPDLLLLWVPAQATIVVMLVWLTGGGIGTRTSCTSIYDPGCAPEGALPAKAGLPCQDWGWSCNLADMGIYYGITSTMAGLFLIMIATYFLFMYLARRELAKLPYSKYRVPDMGLRLQVHIQVVMAALFFLCVIFMWFVHAGTCNSYVLAWYGMLPMQLAMSSLAVINAVMVCPVDPSPRQLYHHQCLQEVVWSERDAEASRAAAAAMKAASAKRLLAEGARLRNGGTVAAAAAAAVAPVRAAAAAAVATARAAAGILTGDGEAREEMEPMFCFETALKAMYLSNLMYYYKEDEGTPFVLETALELYSLQHFELLWQKEPTDTKCLLAWGDGTVVVGFRGTASLANVLADIKVWRAVHPPKRGNYWLWRCPMVHQGFLDAYKAGGLNQRLLQRLREIMGSDDNICTSSGEGLGSGGGGSKGGMRSQYSGGGDVEMGASKGAQGGGGRRRWRVLCTGHSLGGALATLASYDVAKEAERLRVGGIDVQVQLYTFGAPRPGNHAFARDFLRTVQDSWDVIHSDDAVAKGGKFFLLYKRAANRVLVTAEGDILPRPSFLESSVQRGPGHSIKLHLLGAYARSFASVIRGQFESKALGEASRQALRALLGEKYVRDMLGSLLSFHHQQPLLSRLRSHLPHAGPSLHLDSKQPSDIDILHQNSQSSPAATGSAGLLANGSAGASNSMMVGSPPQQPSLPPQQQHGSLGEQLPTWEAVGQAEAAQGERRKLQGGKEAQGSEPGSPVAEVGDLHVASEQRLQG
ncbi:hypothetical protein N2152v2_003102 [Parachlorella kessleri]